MVKMIGKLIAAVTFFLNIHTNAESEYASGLGVVTSQSQTAVHVLLASNLPLHIHFNRSVAATAATYTCHVV